MDNSADAMDISQSTDEPTLVHLPSRPLSPWLRYAHGHSIDDTEVSATARLRVLLDYEFVLQLSGSSWIWSQAHGGSVGVPAGSLAFIPPGFVHAWGYEVGAHLAVHFDLHAKPKIEVPENIHILSESVGPAPIPTMPRFLIGLPGDQLPLSVPLVTSPAAPVDLRERLEVLIDIRSRRVQAGALGYVQATSILTELLTALHGHAGDEAPPPDPRIRDLLRRLHEPENADLGRATVAQLAAQAYMGESAFRAAFVGATGKSPHRYLEGLRIERAARMLLDGDSPVSEVARTVGYGDPYHFSRVFKRVKGRPPSEFRRLVRGT